MSPWVIEVGLVAVSLGAWFALYGAMLLATRPRGVTPAPATQELGDEPPAVVSLVGGDWDLTVDAAEATLLDLGARKVLEFRQPANDPTHTTVHVRVEDPSGLTPYERRVFDRVAGLAVGGVVPLTALTFRDARKAASWWKRLRAEVVADARARGLSRRRFSPAVVGALVAAGGLAALGIAAAVAHNVLRGDEEDPWGTVLGVGFISFLVLATLAGRNIGERDTPAGRDVAARWLGVKAWLRGDDAFGELPPSAVAVWDRYLGYGAALGTTRVSSAVIDLGMGNRRRVWSSYGGTWRRVRVRYPRFGLRYGRTAPPLVLRALAAIGVGYVLARWWRGLVADIAGADDLSGNAVTRFADPVALAGLALGLALIGYGIYALVRVVVDFAAPVAVTGQVLWLQLWQQTTGSDASPPQPTIHYLAIDDGRSDRVTAWALPDALAGPCDTGDTVAASIRRWSRRVGEIRVIERGTPGHAGPEPADAENAVEVALGSAVTAVAAAMRAPALASASLLTAEEVSQALTLPVRLADSPSLGPVGMVQFSTVDKNRVVLMMQVADGTVGRMAWRMNSRGKQLPGIGDAAWHNGNRAVARSGDTTVLVTLMRDGKGRGQQLPWLLQQAITRILHPR